MATGSYMTPIYSRSQSSEILKMEVSRTCHVLAPVLNDPPPPPVYSGYLQRLSARSVTGRRWCRRWFAVKLDGVLYWYRTAKHDHAPLGALGLQNQTISRVPEAGAPHAFKVSKFGESPYYFSADDEDTATSFFLCFRFLYRWISALNQVAATASRVDPYVDESLRNAQLPSISIPNVDCEGPLSKFSQRWKTWRRRYFLLKDASLYFYTDRNAKVALGLFQLHGYKVQSSSLQGQKNAFEAIPPEPRLKHLYFLADTENEKKRYKCFLFSSMTSHYGISLNFMFCKILATKVVISIRLFNRSMDKNWITIKTLACKEYNLQCIIL
ncbi:UNVERIFIED_CONTAM: hypothetical protein NCL1_17652 [Trichonephila clavipes]